LNDEGGHGPGYGWGLADPFWLLSGDRWSTQKHPQIGQHHRACVSGFQIKRLQRIVLTNDYKAKDTYALQNNDPDSYLKTAAYLGKGSPSFRAGAPAVIEETAMAGWSGLKRVEYWLRPGTGETGVNVTRVPSGRAWQDARAATRAASHLGAVVSWARRSRSTVTA